MRNFRFPFHVLEHLKSLAEAKEQTMTAVLCGLIEQAYQKLEEPNEVA